MMHQGRKRAAAALLIVVTGLTLGGVAQTAAAADVSGEARINSLLKRMTQPEKLSLLALDSHQDALKLALPAVPRLGIPSLRTVDSPEGLRDSPASAFPMEVVMASTWDIPLVRQVGAAIGQEARAKNWQVIYGPSVNLQRTPQSGRYFENFTEDPYLNSRLAVSYIEGMQSQGVASCIKHFVCNDQENNRDNLDVSVDERTLHETYLPVFEAAVHEAHVWALMPALVRVNGVYAAQNKALLTDLLKTDWDWNGLVIADWGATHETAGAVVGGSDLEMPEPRFYAPAALTEALQHGLITQAQIDSSVRRVLRLALRTGQMDGPKKPDLSVVNSPAHQLLARKVAEEGIVLLKNKHGLLPLSRTAVKSIAVIGPNAADTQLGGRWSADITPFYRISVLDGLKQSAGAGITVAFAQGCPRNGPGTPETLRDAVTLAGKSDIAVIVVGTDNNYEGESLDPPDLHLPGDQEKLIRLVAAVNPHTLVVLNAGTPLLVSKWLPSVSGLIESWYAGQEAGRAVAEIVFGDVNPSGKLAGTWAVKREDYPDWGNYPGVNSVVHYAEGQFIGYRAFDKHKITPLFPFGFGLSYTSFAYGGLDVPPLIRRGAVSTPITVTVQNTGQRAGVEVVQLYLCPRSAGANRPKRALSSFARVSLLPSQKKTVSLLLSTKAFTIWNPQRHRWQNAPGTYTIEAGSSSQDIRLRRSLRFQ